MKFDQDNMTLTLITPKRNPASVAEKDGDKFKYFN